jgi:tripartite ATP-independent transporter DctM subunit
MVGGLGVFLLKGIGPALSLIGNTPYEWASNGALLAAPLFILMGQFVYQSGISSDLYNTTNKWVGRFPGGLAIATTVASTAFGACCGVSMAGAATFGTIAYPEMQAFKYNRQLSTGSIAAGGSLSSLIPPSMPFIIYGVFTDVSIGKLFLGGVFPGLLLSIVYLVIIIIMCKFNPELGPQGRAYTWRDRLIALKGVIWVLLLVVMIIGGLFAGIFTPSEAGTAGALGAFIIVIAKRKLTFANLWVALKESIMTTCFIITIATGAMIFIKFLAVGGFTVFFRSWVTSLSLSPDAIMICILLIYIPLGMVMDVMAMTLLTLPIVFPIVTALGFDPIWFGIMLTLMGELGNITPPVGMNAFVVSGVTKVPLAEVFRGITPFAIGMLICVGIIYPFPQIVTFLPSIM